MSEFSGIESLNSLHIFNSFTEKNLEENLIQFQFLVTLSSIPTQTLKINILYVCHFIFPKPPLVCLKPCLRLHVCLSEISSFLPASTLHKHLAGEQTKQHLVLCFMLNIVLIFCLYHGVFNNVLLEL